MNDSPSRFIKVLRNETAVCLSSVDLPLHRVNSTSSAGRILCRGTLTT